MTGGPLLRVEDLRVDFPGLAGGRPVPAAVAGIDWEVNVGETVALVGPSGSGKTLTARAVLGLLPPGARRRGRILWEGRDLTTGPPDRWRRLRGREMALVLQEPLAALNPVLTVGDQVAEAVRWLRGCGRDEAHRTMLQLLAEVQLPEPERASRCYPHQLSGGMRQRALIATALAGEPRLLLADEPTTALDVTVQHRLLQLLDHLRRVRGLALVLVSHDLAVVAELAQRAVVLHEGRVVESGPVRALLAEPSHAVTRAMVEAYRRRHVPRPPAADAPVVSARNIEVRYGSGGRPAVDGVDVDLDRGRVLGLAGESGCGKTSLALALTRFVPARATRLQLAGEDLLALRGARLRRARRRIQLVFQDPHASLNPRRTVAQTLAEALAAGRTPGTGGPGRRNAGARAAADAVRALAAEMDLGAELLPRYPHALSGGQRQRVAIARALAVDPDVIIADEPTSALDAPVRVKLLERLLAAQERRGLALLLISHDLDLLERFSDRVAVMLDGVVVEERPLASSPSFLHPYSCALAAAAPRLARSSAGGSAPPATAAGDPTSRPDGRNACPHVARCALSEARCRASLPPLVEVAPGHRIRCFPVCDAPRPIY
ncbi:MAG: ABC transporter ATP-binding protein [Candidatus Krumholzibacteriia bacterium]